jgi:hypothetical protein
MFPRARQALDRRMPRSHGHENERLGGRERSEGMSRSTRRALPSICVDEHLGPRVAGAFRPIFRTIEAAKTRALKGRDEREYLPELFRENALFVTSDAEFVAEVRRAGVRHAGIVFIPTEMTENEKVLFAQIAGGFVQGGCHSSRFQFRNRLLYPAHDGLRSTLLSRRAELEFSWEWFSRQI